MEMVSINQRKKYLVVGFNQINKPLTVVYDYVTHVHYDTMTKKLQSFTIDNTIGNNDCSMYVLLKLTFLPKLHTYVRTSQQFPLIKSSTRFAPTHF